jgi:CRP/FNR family transcriptional regulator
MSAIQLSTTEARAFSATMLRVAATPVRPCDRHASQTAADTLKLLSECLAPRRRVVHAGDVVYSAGERFEALYVLNSGFFKMVNLAADGREQVVSLKFRGDWLGFDGIAASAYSCDAVAMDTGEVWVIRYDELLAASVAHPALLWALHAAMSARVAEFLRSWADSLAKSGLRSDQITLRLTRAEIGNYLGMTLETVSRALSRLARDEVIEFAEKGRRDIRIPDVDALSAFIQRCLAPTTLQ